MPKGVLRVVPFGALPEEAVAVEPFETDPPAALGRVGAFDLTTVLEWTTDAVIAVGEDARIVFWNRAAEALFGYTAEEAIGQSVFLLYPNGRRPEGEQILADIQAGLPVGRLETVRRHKSGRLLELEITYSPLLDNRGEPVGAASISREIGSTRRRERALTDFLDNAAIGMHWVDASGLILYANRTHLATLGYEPDEYIGHNVREFYDPPEGVDGVLARLAAGEALRGMEARMRARDGRLRTVSIDSSGVFEGGRLVATRCFIRDVTENRLIEEERDRLASIVASSHDAIILSDVDGTIRAWNRGAEETLGYRADEMIGRPIASILSSNARAERLRWQAALEEGADVPAQATQVIHRDGRVLDVSERMFAARDASGRLIGIATITRDLTEANAHARELETYRKQLESMVAERTRELESALDRLRRTNEDLREFAEVAAHDLREPLRKISQFGDLLRRELAGLDKPEAAHHLDRVIDGANRMGRLIEDLRQYAAVGQRKETLKPIDLLATMHEVLVDLEATIADSGATVDVAPLPEIVADGVQMHHLFLNLLSNALKFRRPGVAPVVTVTGRTEGRYALIEVRDNGVGFDPRYAARLFRPFARLHAGYEGTGMGLAIVGRIVDRAGGTVTATSQRDQGATFTVRLPLEGPPAGSGS